MNSKVICFFLIFSISLPVLSQVGGGSIYSFLNLPYSARQAALGGKQITLYNGESSDGLLNPASINEKMNAQLSMNYTNYIADVNYGTVAYTHKIIDPDHFLLIGVQYINYGSFDGYDELGNFTQTFSGNDVAVSLGYAYNIPRSNFRIGTNLKAISSNLEQYSSFGLALDMAILYLVPNSHYTISIVARNIGTQLKVYDNLRESLPLDLLIGVSNKLENIPLSWHLSLDKLNKWNSIYTMTKDEELNDYKIKKEKGLKSLSQHLILGIELFPEQRLNLRLGYNFRRSSELKITDQRTFAGLNAGFGLRFRTLKVNYAFAKYSKAITTNHFGLQIEL